MHSPLTLSQISIIRRTAERGLKLAQQEDKKFIDIFQHMLDELERLENEEEYMPFM